MVPRRKADEERQLVNHSDNRGSMYEIRGWISQTTVIKGVWFGYVFTYVKGEKGVSLAISEIYCSYRG
jgi:hypothetical protein